MKDVHKITLNDYESQIGVKAKDIVPVEEMEPGDLIGQNQMGFVGHADHGGIVTTLSYLINVGPCLFFFKNLPHLHKFNFQ